MNKLYIVRGLPGSGKSTYVLKNLHNVLHFEADKFYINDQHEYNFDSNLISVAHEWCFSNVVKALRDGHDVAVSNTFTKMWELDKYLTLKEKYGLNVEIKIIEIKTQFDNIHGVPEGKLEQMKNRWAEIPEELGLDVTRITNASS